MCTCIEKKKKGNVLKSTQIKKKVKIAPNSHYPEVTTINVCDKYPTRTPQFYTNGITLSLLSYIFPRHH